VVTTRTITVDALARVEGEGALTLVLDGDRPPDVRLRIFEPPRFFEALLVGRPALEAPDITARICGICPVAYQMSACHAIEAAYGVRPAGALRALRRLLYCGEWIESHVLHMVMLHAPDFLGVPDVMALSARAPERVAGALRIKKAGNAIVARLGGREIHPINVRVGGFYRAPSIAALRGLLPQLVAAREEAEELLAWCAGFSFPRHQRDIELVALRHPDEYALNEGRWASTGGMDLAVDEIDAALVEEQVDHSTALHARLAGRGAYLTGPQARLALSFELLAPRALEAARRAGVSPADGRNPFRSILARGVEVVHALDEAVRLIEGYAPPAVPAVELPREPPLRRGAAVTEAPRGSLFHRYELDADGVIRAARIVPPTSQNQRAIESDLRGMAAMLAELPDEEARVRAEHAIRNHDPCISCATHFLRYTVERR
jgi:coenzyme F420-reducing hydrogenase alpha subunit